MRVLLTILALALSVLAGAWIRAETALRDPRFDAQDARGLLRSDPALLYYLAEEITNSTRAGALTPADFRADPRIQHPYVTDVPAEFPFGNEFLAAWAQVLSGTARPLHVTALWVAAFTAALFVLGVFLAVRALTDSDAWAGLAVLLALVTPANYRTIGFLLVGEDLALPLFMLHLGVLVHATRSGSARAYLLSGCCAAAALSAWHALSFVITLELAVLFAGLLLDGRSALGAPRVWLALLPPLAAGLCVPVLRASGLLCSPAAALVLALAVPALVARRWPLSPTRARVLALALLGVAMPALGLLAPAAYGHVHQVVLAKLRLLGRFPDDPGELSFDARLLWQGPFETLPPEDLLAWAGWPLAVLFVAGLWAPVRRWGRTVGGERLLLGLALAALPAAWMFARLVVLVGLLAPAVCAVGLARAPRRRLALSCLAALTLVQGLLFADFIGAHRVSWYLPAPARAELRALLEWVERNVPADEPVLGDFVNSTAVLAHTRRPIVLQPKYETDRSRRQAEAFLTAFFRGPPAELAQAMRTRFACRTLLVDGFVLGELSRATAGLRAGEPLAPGSAAAAFLADDDAALRAIPGFELRYRSPPGIAGADYRVFVLSP